MGRRPRLVVGIPWVGRPRLVVGIPWAPSAARRRQPVGRRPSAAPAVHEQVRRPDLYLLTEDAGAPFEDDGLRDGEHLRRWMTGRFRDELGALGVRHLVLSGSYRQRLSAAVRATDDLLARGWVSRRG